LRFDYEMNGDWVPWSETANGSRAGEFVQAWRHVHDIFTSAGANNVTWVWCPNVELSATPSDRATLPLEGLYPGDAYVDWTCMDGYNWGANPARGGRWQSFDEVFRSTYEHLLKIAPGKPVMIGETSSSEYGGDKAGWIADVLENKLPRQYPRIKALVWFNVNASKMDWVIETSGNATLAFRQGIARDYYLGARFKYLGNSPIPEP
jgi:beta-mannanase